MIERGMIERGMIEREVVACADFSTAKRRRQQDMEILGGVVGQGG